MNKHEEKRKFFESEKTRLREEKQRILEREKQKIIQLHNIDLEQHEQRYKNNSETQKKGYSDQHDTLRK
jgi:hypothetical protein